MKAYGENGKLQPAQPYKNGEITGITKEYCES